MGPDFLEERRIGTPRDAASDGQLPSSQWEPHVVHLEQAREERLDPEGRRRLRELPIDRADAMRCLILHKR